MALLRSGEHTPPPQPPRLARDSYPSHLLLLLPAGLRRRQRDPLSHSSLSHAVFRLHIEVAAILPGPAAPIITTTAAAAAGSVTEVDVPVTRRGVLTIVDLAGRYAPI